MAGELLEELWMGQVEELLVTDDLSTKESIAQQINTALNNPLPLFIIAGVLDLTQAIEVPTYRVNMKDGYDEWTDMNKVDHHDINKQKAEGTFSVKFQTLEEFQTFLIVMKDYKKSNGAYDCSVYCTNLLTTINAEMYIDFDPPNVMPYIGYKDYDSIEITVNQRTNQYIRQ
jgi:hypothetical protein